MIPSDTALALGALRETLARLLEKVLEQKHRAGYARHPVQEGEFDLWEGEQVWVDW